MKVIATQAAFYKSSRVREGDVINLDDGAKVEPWMAPVSKAQAAKPPQDLGPQTLSEMTRRDERRDAKASGRA